MILETNDVIWFCNLRADPALNICWVNEWIILAQGNGLPPLIGKLASKNELSSGFSHLKLRVWQCDRKHNCPSQTHQSVVHSRCEWRAVLYSSATTHTVISSGEKYKNLWVYAINVSSIPQILFKLLIKNLHIPSLGFWAQSLEII